MNDNDEIIEDFDTLEDVLDELLDRDNDKQFCVFCGENYRDDCVHECRRDEDI